MSIELTTVKLAGQSFSVPADKAAQLKRESKAALAVGSLMAKSIKDDAKAVENGLKTLHGLHMLLHGSDYVDPSSKPIGQNVVSWFHGELMGSCVRMVNKKPVLEACEGAEDSELIAAQRTLGMASEWSTASRAVVECSPPSNITNRRTLAEWFRDSESIRKEAKKLAEQNPELGKKARAKYAEDHAKSIMAEATKLAEKGSDELSSAQVAEVLASSIPDTFIDNGLRFSKRIESRDTTAKRAEAAKAPKGTKAALEALRASFDVLGAGHHGAVSAVLVDVLGWKQAAKLAEVLDTACTDAKNG